MLTYILILFSEVNVKPNYFGTSEMFEKIYFEVFWVSGKQIEI